MLTEPPSTSALRVYLSAPEVAVLLRTTLRGVYARLQRGGMPEPRRVGRRLLWNRKEICSWIEQQ